LCDVIPFIPSIVVSLLHEFEDMFYEDVPSGLPPLKVIEHHFDLIHATVIPNRSTYISNLKKTNDI
jgi:hypothetical protein